MAGAGWTWRSSKIPAIPRLKEVAGLQGHLSTVRLRLDRLIQKFEQRLAAADHVAWRSSEGCVWQDKLDFDL